MTTLTHPTLGVVDIPDDLLWTDEFTWQAVLQSTEYTTTGAMVVDAWAKQAGRTITLEGSQNFGWVSRSVINTLFAWSKEPATTFTLNLRGVNRSVVFNHENGAISAEAVVDFSDPLDTDHYVISLRFLEL